MGLPLLQWGDVGVAQEAAAVSIRVSSNHGGASGQRLKEVSKSSLLTDLQVAYQDASHIEPCLGLSSALQSGHQVGWELFQPSWQKPIARPSRRWCQVGQILDPRVYYCRSSNVHSNLRWKSAFEHSDQAVMVLCGEGNPHQHLHVDQGT